MLESEQGAGIGRRRGVALWRQIADRMREEIPYWLEHRDGRVPTEAELAERFEVNRHTVRAASAALSQEGLIRSERGRGTFVNRLPRLTYPIGARTRFSAALEAQNASGRIELRGHRVETPDGTVAELLGLAKDRGALRLDTIGIAEVRPLSFATHWFDAERFAAVPDILAATGSITRALAACGVGDYMRKWTRLEARLAFPEEAAALDLGEGGVVMVARAVNCETDGTPIQYSVTRFAGDRIEISIDGS
jgi:GntR family phosphonate transport system transcriptional regulator